MITAMVKLPDGKVLNKILVTDEELAEDDICHCEDRIIELANGVVALAFKDGMRVTTQKLMILLKQYSKTGLDVL